MSIEKPDQGPKRRVERRKDPDTRTRVAAMEQELVQIHETYKRIERAFARLARLTRWLLGALFVSQAVLGGFVVVLLNDNSNRITDIQNSRLTACVETNAKHNNTVLALTRLRQQEIATEGAQIVRLFAAAGVKVKHPIVLERLQVASINASFTSTLGLINALAPARDCSTAVGAIH